MTARNGTWLVLVGILLYLAEFVGMAIAGGYPYVEPGSSPGEAAAALDGLAEGAGFLVGWMAFVLTGRILVVIGLRAACGPSALLDWAVAAMTVSVALEVASVASLAAASASATGDGGADGVLPLVASAGFLETASVPPAGLAAVLCAIVMWRSRDFPRFLAVLGGFAGVVIVVSGLLPPSMRELADALSVAVMAWWAWALWTGILLAVRTRRVGARRDDGAGGEPLHDSVGSSAD
ncbi:DUF4386 family protein [Agromyces sp. SYSU T00266]|uniref:DUF4386 family protein n=1 Tax=Agromyces zhanjiangensis TaxID=3158562 RepID=UPI0033966263